MLDSINIRSNVAVYLQIENTVQFAIASGKLKDGDQLPSVRELSNRLNVNPNTAAKAYRDLEVMGLLFTRRGMGVYIKKDVRSKCREECNRKIFSRLHEVVAEAKASGMSKKDILDGVNTSFPIADKPYDETPKAVLSLSKSKK